MKWDGFEDGSDEKVRKIQAASVVLLSDNPPIGLMSGELVDGAHTLRCSFNPGPDLRQISGYEHGSFRAGEGANSFSRNSAASYTLLAFFNHGNETEGYTGACTFFNLPHSDKPIRSGSSDATNLS